MSSKRKTERKLRKDKGILVAEPASGSATLSMWMDRLPSWSWAVAVFLVSVLVIQGLAGNRLTLSLDEGIYLYEAQRILAGQAAYRDFFVVTGPGTVWLFAGLFKVFGNSFAAAHWLLSAEVSAITVSLYLVVRKFSTRMAGWTAALCWLALHVPYASRLYVNHRWDSACFATVAVALLLCGFESWPLVLIAGMFAGAAGVFTPPVLLVAAAVFLALLVKRDTWQSAFLWAAGTAVSLSAATCVLALQGALMPMLQTLQWASQHYQQTNSVPYGFRVAGPNAAATLEGLVLLIPAILPVVAGVILVLVRSRPITVSTPVLVLAASGYGMVFACYPRWAANQLMFTFPFFCSLLLLLASALLPKSAVRLNCWAITAVSGITILFALLSSPKLVEADTQLGTVLCTPKDRANIDFATSTIHPGDTLFVFPYQPIWYALTGSTNPTPHNWLQPGMMTEQDESAVLKELVAHPPQWVIWHNLTKKSILSVWPNSDIKTLRFARIEQFLKANYTPISAPVASYRYSIALLRHITD